MTFLYSSDDKTMIEFETNDNYPHASDYILGQPFHLLRISEKAAIRGFLSEMVYAILRQAVNNFRQNDGIHYSTDYPDIIDCNYEKKDFEDIRISTFETNGYVVAITTLIPS